MEVEENKLSKEEKAERLLETCLGVNKKLTNENLGRGKRQR